MFKVAQIDDYIPDVRLEDIPTESQWIAEEFGLDVLLHLCRYCGGTNLYVPRITHVCVPAKLRMIRAEFDGENIKELAMRHQLTQRRIQDIVKDI